MAIFRVLYGRVSKPMKNIKSNLKIPKLMLTLRQQLRINLNRIRNSPGFHVIRGGFEGDSLEIRGGFEGDSRGIGLRLEGDLRGIRGEFEGECGRWEGD